MIGVEDKERFLATVVKPNCATDLVYQAFVTVDRRDFTPEKFQHLAYTDSIIDLSGEASISQPSLVALMMEMLEPNRDGKMLEVGTASGYGAALLSRCSREVHTIELDPQLAQSARERLKRLGFSNVFVHEGDGVLGLPDQAPFDGIIVTAGAKDIPPPTLVEQLQEGGKMVIPIGNDTTKQVLVQCVRNGDRVNILALTRPPGHHPLEVNFHLLYSPTEGGWTKEAVERVVGFKVFVLEAFARTLRMPVNELVDLLTTHFKNTPPDLVAMMLLPPTFRAEDFKFADDQNSEEGRKKLD